ncbi:MAG: Nascent polypeptide-associated complex protein [Candidatus Helarchaeota archaeon]|nr:Nascent polypeptide-associated complex protein [Candidatus Helarchaeota archaeon]
MQQKRKKSSPKDMKKMMRKMQKQGQMDFNEIQNVEEVIIRTAEKDIVIEGAQVTKLMVPGQGEMYQVIGDGVDRAKSAESAVAEEGQVEEEGAISPEDAQLVAGQAGVSLEEAEAALRQTGGDLAKAILLLKQSNF